MASLSLSARALWIITTTNCPVCSLVIYNIDILQREPYRNLHLYQLQLKEKKKKEFPIGSRGSLFARVYNDEQREYEYIEMESLETVLREKNNLVKNFSRKSVILFYVKLSMTQDFIVFLILC